MVNNDESWNAPRQEYMARRKSPGPTSEEIERAKDEFKKKGGLIRILPDQVALKRPINPKDYSPYEKIF